MSAHPSGQGPAVRCPFGPLSFLEIFSCVRNCDCNSLIPVMFNKKHPLPFVGFAESLGVGLTFPHAFIYLDISGKICE